MPRLYDIDSGRISIGETSLNDLEISFLRERIGIVNQSPFLFNATIKENISYGLKSPTLKQIKIAAEQSQAVEFIEKLPKGYDTIVGERGQMLSGGQQQRIAIARTVIRNPDIIIFDEATSSVDNKTEQLIQKPYLIFKKEEHRLSLLIDYLRLETVVQFFLLKMAKSLKKVTTNFW